MNQNEYLKNLRRSSRFLALSISLNVLLLAFIGYSFFRERPPAPYCIGKPALPQEEKTPLAIDRTNAQVLRYLKTLSMERLISKLSAKELVENGYSQRDLALGILVSFHDFDLKRALQGEFPKEQRLLEFGKREVGPKAEVTVFPGISDENFEKIIRFAKQEKWPLKPHGLFLHLKNQDDPSLQDAFFLTSEFLTVERLLKRANASLERKEILAMLLELDWEMLLDFTLSQKRVQDLSSAMRQKFLLDAILMHSKEAAKILLKTDPEFAIKKLDDPTVTLILSLLDGEEKERFGRALVDSPRGDLVLQQAKKSLKNKEEESVSPKEEENIYIVQEGDSLWKIARRFKVDVEELKKVNHLQSDLLRKGVSLKIP